LLTPRSPKKGQEKTSSGYSKSSPFEKEPVQEIVLPKIQGKTPRPFGGEILKSLETIDVLL
jgi:hypothetical protein